jgi:SecD/SecF fusion protein
VTNSRRRLAAFVGALLCLVHNVTAADFELAVETAKIGLDPFTAAPIVEAVLTTEGRKAFAKLTLAHIGDVIELRVDGELLTAPVVQSPILDGKLVISGSMTATEARSLAARLSDQGAVITLTPLER